MGLGLKHICKGKLLKRKHLAASVAGSAAGLDLGLS